MTTHLRNFQNIHLHLRTSKVELSLRYTGLLAYDLYWSFGPKMIPAIFEHIEPSAKQAREYMQKNLLKSVEFALEVDNARKKNPAGVFWINTSTKVLRSDILGYFRMPNIHVWEATLNPEPQI